MQTFQTNVNHFLGVGTTAPDLSIGQTLCRGAVISLTMYIMMRIAGRRFIANRNSFDTLLAFLTASMMARAINGNIPFWGTVVTGLVIAVAYRAMSWLACEFHLLGRWLKGEPEILLVNGSLKKSIMRRHHVSQNDLCEDMRLNGGVSELEKVKEARIERSGEISIQRQPQVIDVRVDKNVQTIRLLIE